MLLKFGSARRLVISNALAVSLVAMLSASVLNVSIACAEQSDDARDAIRKQRLEKRGLFGATVPSNQSFTPIASGKATTETEVFADQTVDRKSTRLNSSHPRLSRMPSSA